jgi:hypothetical protein
MTVAFVAFWISFRIAEISRVEACDRSARARTS